MRLKRNISDINNYFKKGITTQRNWVGGVDGESER